MTCKEKQQEEIEILYKGGFEEFVDKEIFLEAFNKLLAEVEEKIDPKKVDYKKEEERKIALPNRIIKVYHRLKLANELSSKIGMADNIIQTIMFPGLVTYLLLTCFDQLGQPAPGWLDFASWLNASSTKEEVETVIGKIYNPDDAPISLLEGTKTINKEYSKIYGVKSSFFYFIDSLLPEKAKRNLLDSIQIDRLMNNGDEPNDQSLSESDTFKKKWLFKTRNDYTHSLETVESNISHGSVIDGERWFIRDKVFKPKYTDVIWVTEDFNNVLIKTVKIGSLALIIPEEIEGITEKYLPVKIDLADLPWFEDLAS
jgi:hypothetical protein